MDEIGRRHIVVEFASDGDDEAILAEVVAITKRLDAEHRRLGGSGLMIVSIQMDRGSDAAPPA